MKTFTVSINPDKYEWEDLSKEDLRNGQSLLAFSGELKKLDVMDLFESYISNYVGEMEEYKKKYPEKKERILEYSKRLEILLKIKNSYSSFYYEAKQYKHKTVSLSIKLQDAYINISNLKKEMEKVEKVFNEMENV